MKLQLISTAALCGLLALVAPAQAQGPLKEREAKLLSQYRAQPNPNTLDALATVREEMGKWPSAEDNWGLMLRYYGGQESLSYSVSANDHAKTMNYAELATWTLKRLERKRNLQSRPVSKAQKGAAARAETRFLDKPPVKFLEAYRRIDMDGDGIMEIVLYGRSGPLGKGKRNSISIHKWDGHTTYRPIWRASGRLPVEVEYGDYDKDELKDGFAEVTLIYTPNSDDIATLHYNGSSFMAYSSV